MSSTLTLLLAPPLSLLSYPTNEMIESMNFLKYSPTGKSIKISWKSETKSPSLLALTDFKPENSPSGFIEALVIAMF
jgi:hypothetical protein